MARNAILHLADLHVGAPVAPKLRENFPWVAEKLQSVRDGLLSRIADWVCAPESEVGLVLIAGDLFDHHNPDRALEDCVIQALSRILGEGIPVITVPGNHDDLNYPGGIFRRRPWPGILVTNLEAAVVFEAEAGAIFRRPLKVVSACFQRGKSKQAEFFDPPQLSADCFGVALLHGLVVDENHLPVLIAEQSDLLRTSLKTNQERGYGYTALGHIHRQSHCVVQNMAACYPGPPIGTGPADPGSGSLVLVREALTASGRSYPANVRLQFVSPPEIFPLRWLFMEERVSGSDRPNDVFLRVQQQLAGKEDQLVALSLTGAVSSRTFVEDCQALFVQARLTVVVSDTKIQRLLPTDLKLHEQENTLLGEWIRQWRKWQEDENPDPEFAEAVLWEALACFGHG